MNYQRKHEQLVERLRERESLSRKTVDAMRSVPRHRFVPESKRGSAYDDRPLPIGEGQTISAPHMVAVMVELLDLSAGDRVLEIGTGCGYHAAVTAEIVGLENVYTVEYHEELAERARKTLTDLGYGEIQVRVGDGREGWEEHAPYDRAYLTCAANSFPDALVEQVRTGGILLGPIDEGRQLLVRATVNEGGSLEREQHGYVRFVPLQ